MRGWNNGNKVSGSGYKVAGVLRVVFGDLEWSVV
ncbi:MAG: hypothetical protein ACJAQ5_001676 [Flavobacteriales bacterium]|jgi:hypothetical protein